MQIPDPNLTGDHASYVAIFFAAAFLSNCIPHLTSGLQGLPFPTPFAKPRGYGDSSPVVNVIWGAANLLIGACLLSRHPITIGLNAGFIEFVVLALAMGIGMSYRFGKVRRDKASKLEKT